MTPLTAANPLTDEAAAQLPLADAEQEMLELIAAQPLGPGTPARRAGLRGPRPRLVLVAAAAIIAVVVVLAALPSGGRDGGPTAAYGAELVHFAQASPLVLLEATGWHVDYADEYSAQQGEMHYVRDGVEADLFWRSGPLAGWVRDRAASASVRTSGHVLGTGAQVFEYRGGHPGAQDITALWSYDGRVLEFRTTVADIPAYLRLLGALRTVDAATWLDALPASVVRSAQRAGTIKAMLRGIPLPPGFDPAAIPGSRLVSDRYQLGAAVTGWSPAVAPRLVAGSPTAATGTPSTRRSRRWPPRRDLADPPRDEHARAPTPRC